ncbi:MAG: hypothetical protein ABW166_20675 [Sedimenticola sp.]
MSHEEREDNEDNGLGELPMPNRIERGENIGYSNEGTRFDRFGGKSLLDNRNYGAPYDISQENDVRSRPGEIGSVPRRFDVTSTFDARPVNARDFLETFLITIVPGEGPTTESNSFTVPDGYIGVVRGFRYFVSNVVDVFGEPFLVSLIANSTIVSNYDNMALPQILNAPIPCYAISNYLKNIGLKINHPPVRGGLDRDVEIRVEMYGNLLLSRGIPSQYEPANYA